jgi:hypothetical protein
MEILSRRGGVPAGRIAYTGLDAHPAEHAGYLIVETAAQLGADVYVSPLRLEKLGVGLGM